MFLGRQYVRTTRASQEALAVCQIMSEPTNFEIFQYIISNHTVYWKNYANLLQSFRFMCDEDFGAADKSGRTFVFICAQHGNKSCLELLLEETVHRNQKYLLNFPSNGFTPLMAATQGGHFECVKVLLDYGAKPTQYSVYPPAFKACAFDIAIVHNKPQILKYFLPHVNLKMFAPTWPLEPFPVRRNKPLHVAIEFENTVCMKALLASGYPIDSVDYWPLNNCANLKPSTTEGQVHKVTELTLAIDVRNIEAITHLLRNNANPNGAPDTVPPICCIFAPNEVELNVALCKLLLTFGAKYDILYEARIENSHLFWKNILLESMYLKLLLEYGLDLTVYMDSELIRRTFFEAVSTEIKQGNFLVQKSMEIIVKFMNKRHFSHAKDVKFVSEAKKCLCERFAAFNGTIVETPNSLKDMCRIYMRRGIHYKYNHTDVAFPFAVESSSFNPDVKKLLQFKDY